MTAGAEVTRMATELSVQDGFLSSASAGMIEQLEDGSPGIFLSLSMQSFHAAHLGFLTAWQSQGNQTSHMAVGFLQNKKSDQTSEVTQYHCHCIL